MIERHYSMTDKVRIVWILGAGFSKPLGGPLLKDLFTTSSFDAMQYRFPKEEYSGLYNNPAQAVHFLYNEDRRKGEGREWADAEEFLDALDAAVRAGAVSSSTSRLMKRVEPFFKDTDDVRDLKPVLLAAKRLLSAECAGFLVDADTDQEKWNPFHYWASNITGDDCIITFNYDLVLERLEKKPHDGFMVQVVTPSTKKRISGRAPIFKLHGSINWGNIEFSKGREFRVVEDYFALRCTGDELVIASPGPSKEITTGELTVIWGHAEKALKNCEAVVFVGYRFPPTDSRAREFILESLSENKQPYIAVHTVLGPQSQHDSARLEQLLSWTMNKAKRKEVKRPTNNIKGYKYSYNLIKHQLYAQDFFSVFTDEIILKPHKWPEMSG